MKKHFLILGLIGLLGCADNEKPKPPAGLLPTGKLVSILADFHIAEARIEAMRVGADTAKILYDRQQAEILKKRGVPQKEFDKTYDFYLNKDLNGLDKIYEALVDTLSLREVKFGAPPPNPEKQPTDPALVK